MTDYPEGEWSQILVGHVWPSASNLELIANQSINFANTSAEYLHFESQLGRARSGPLANQEGLAAENLQDTFKRGEKDSHDIAEKNELKKISYDSIYTTLSELRSTLSAIARDGNSKIKEVQISKDPEPIKIGKIVAIVSNSQNQANTTAAMHGDNILNATQKILNSEGIFTSARQFSIERGVNTNHLFRPLNTKSVENHVKTRINSHESSLIPGPTGDLTPLPRAAASPENTPTATAPGGTEILPTSNWPCPRSTPFLANPGEAANLTPSLAASASPLPQVPIPVATPPQIAAPSVSGAPSLPSIPAAVSAPSITPGELLQSFDHGMQTGTPMSAAVNALAGGPMAAIESHLTPPAPETPAAPATSNIPASTHAAAYEASAHSPAALTEASPPQNHTATADSSTTNTTYLAAPAGALPPTPAGLSPTSPLPAYGTDIRPPAPAASTTAVPTGLHPAAPVSPSPAGSHISQPAVVRQSAQPVHPTASVQGAQTPSGAVARAVASTAAGTVTGAGAGAGSANVAARKRLQRLVDAVAQQEPRLRWAAGDRLDGTTVLVTDLASGWIPPHIDVPAGMELCKPAYRRGNIQTLLGEVTVAADYTALHSAPTLAASEPVAVSPRARQVPVIEELGWQLGQATQRRDGLPRLAHTLAIAAVRGTGVLDSEIELLRMKVDKLRERVLQSYPNHVEAAAVTDWQLLAAIDALVSRDRIGATYHFAWFQALGQAPQNRQFS